MKESRLLALPAELRNEIYELVLVSPSDVPIYRTHPADITAQSCPAPPLLQTCRKVRAEASAIFYGRNNFDIKTWHSRDSIVTLGMWLKGLRAEDWGLVKRVNLQHVGADGWKIGYYTEGEIYFAREVEMEVEETDAEKDADLD